MPRDRMVCNLRRVLATGLRAGFGLQAGTGMFGLQAEN
jgi:hypothetical protein